MRTAISLLVAIVSFGCGQAGAGAASQVPPPATSASPSSTATAEQLPTANLPAFACTDLAGGTAGAVADVTGVRVGTASGYDRFVIQFSGPVPAYTVVGQGTPTFSQDASGQMLTLLGSNGAKVVVRGAMAMSGGGWSEDQKPGYPELKEARQLGDFERVYSWGLGLAGGTGACQRALVLTRPDRLVIDLQQPGS